ncbi:MAG: DUF2807 domain-containing protein [candidate division Zixibacteria bacterium]|nr:DUF2807 domain-containing protein [candidate division Zixibacteria bacterium]
MRRIVGVTLTLAGLVALCAYPVLARDHWTFFGKSSRTIDGSGNVVTVDRSVGSFDRIESYIGADLEITVGGEPKVTLTGDDNIVELVTTRVRGGALEIDSRKSFSTRRDIKVAITVPSLKELALNGSGDVQLFKLSGDKFTLDISGSADVTCEGSVRYLEIDIDGSGEALLSDLACERIEVGLAGSGEVRLSGTCKDLNIDVPGSGNVDARELKCANVRATIDGSGDIDVWADESFDGSIDGSGDIRYWGNARDISRDVNGSGRIVRKR